MTASETHARIAGIKKMGREECQVCGGDYKAPNGRLSVHGYERPGDGYIRGRCQGARNLPFDQSKDQIVETTKYYRGKIERLEKLLAGDAIGTTAPLKATFFVVDGKDRDGQPWMREINYEAFSTQKEYEALCAKYAEGLQHKLRHLSENRRFYPTFDDIVEDERYHREAELRGAKSFVTFLVKREAEWDAAYGKPVKPTKPVKKSAKAFVAEVAETEAKPEALTADIVAKSQSRMLEDTNRQVKEWTGNIADVNAQLKEHADYVAGLREERNRLSAENTHLRAEIARLKASQQPDTCEDGDGMTVKEIGKLFGVDRTTVYVWMKTRDFPQPCGFEGRAKLWSRKAVLAWKGG